MTERRETMDAVAVVCWGEYKYNKQYLNDSMYKPINYNKKRNQTQNRSRGNCIQNWNG